MTLAYAPSIMRKTLCHAFEAKKPTTKVFPKKSRMRLGATAALMLFLGLLAPRTAWGQFYVYTGYDYMNFSSLSSAITASANGIIQMTGNGTIDANIMINKNITIEPYNSPSDNGRWTLTRGGAYNITVSRGYTLTIKNIHIDGNNISHTNILFDVIGTMKMEGKNPTTGDYDHGYCSIKNCIKAASNGGENGGAIQVIEGQLECKGVAFENNRNLDYHESLTGDTFGGGAISIVSGGSCDLSDCYFANNSALECGGAILFKLANNSRINNCIFGSSGNPNYSYYGGGAIYGIMKNNHTLDITGTTTFAYNEVRYAPDAGLTYLDNPKEQGTGGAVGFLTQPGYINTFNIGVNANDNITFNNNYARGGGGALAYYCFDNNSQLNLGHTTMENNWTGNITHAEPDDNNIADQEATDNGHGRGRGGAIYYYVYKTVTNQSTDRFTINGCTIRNNRTTDDGGGIYVENGSMTIQDTEITGNMAYNNSASSNGRGGGICMTFRGSLELKGNTKVNDNFAKHEGGGICLVPKVKKRYLDPHNNYYYQYDSDTRCVANLTLEGNASNFVEVNENNKRGVKNGYLQDPESDDCTYYNLYGAGIRFNSAGNISLDYARVNGNDRNDIYTEQAGHEGVGININNQGGGNAPTATIKNSEIIGNNGHFEVHGVGIYAVVDTLAMTNTKVLENKGISRNYDNPTGGGLSLSCNASNKGISLKDCDIIGNEVRTNGGGIQFGQGRLWMERCTIQKNAATGWYGGGIYLNTGTTAHIKDCTIGGKDANGNSAGNSAGDNGGGVYAMSCNAYFDNTEISYNRSNYNRSGGGVYFAHSTAELTNGTEVKHNNATLDGGGIYISGGHVTMENASVSNNSASRNGGGIYVLYSSDNPIELEATSTTIEYNKATSDGGGVFLAQNAVANFTGTDANKMQIQYNEAGAINTTNGYGAGVYIDSNASLLLNGSDTDGVLIKHNHGNSKGGGVYKLGSLKVQGKVTITDNTSGQ